jgi:hypothetical protein
MRSLARKWKSPTTDDHTKSTTRKLNSYEMSLFKEKKREQKEKLLYLSPSLTTYSYLYLRTVFYFGTDHFSVYSC